MKPRRVVIQVEVETTASIASIQKWVAVRVRGGKPLKLMEQPKVNVVRK